MNKNITIPEMRTKIESLRKEAIMIEMLADQLEEKEYSGKDYHGFILRKYQMKNKKTEKSWWIWTASRSIRNKKYRVSLGSRLSPSWKQSIDDYIDRKKIRDKL